MLTWCSSFPQIISDQAKRRAVALPQRASRWHIKNTGLDHARLLISVPKKTFKRAVKRNLYKRRIRESWRKQKHLLTEGTGIDIMIKYASKELLTYEEIYTAIGQIIEKVNHQIAKSRENEQVQSDS